MFRYTGASMPTSYVPATSVRVSDQMSIVERSKNLFGATASVAVFDHLILPAFTKIFRKRFGEDFPSIPVR